MGGILYVVATPIGNLADLTQRAAQVLGEVDLVACEDTRQTRKLLSHCNLRTPTVSYHEHNEASRAPQLLGKLSQGASIALVSDAGTPLVSDPGYRLVSAARKQGIRVVPVPGASAVLAALAGSGLSGNSFYFGGFLPAKTGQRRKELEQRRGEACTLVYYEAPHRILDALADVEAVFGDRTVVMAREVTKLHEEFLHGTAADLLAELKRRPTVKGEITLLIAGASRENPAAGEQTPESVKGAIAAHLERGASRMEAIKAVSRELGMPKREVYRLLEQAG